MAAATSVAKANQLVTRQYRAPLSCRRSSESFRRELAAWYIPRSGSALRARTGPNKRQQVCNSGNVKKSLSLCRSPH